MLPLIVSILAPLFGTVQLIPQLYKTYHTRSVEDLSIHTIIMIMVTDILWLIHGFIGNTEIKALLLKLLNLWPIFFPTF